MIKVIEIICMTLAIAIAGTSITTRDDKTIGIYWLFVAVYWVIRLNQWRDKNEMDDYQRH